MSPQQIEQALRDLSRSGKLVKDRTYRQVWRFEFADRAYYLKFHPHGGLRNWLSRRFRGNKALRELYRLQWLQKAAIPAPHAIASLLGFSIDHTKGDAVILDAIEPSVQLDRHLNRLQVAAQPIPNHLLLARQLVDLLHRLARAGLGHRDLHLGNILLSNDRLFLVDGYEVHKGGLNMNDLLLLAFSVEPYATRTDLCRVWRRLGPSSAPPPANSRAPALWRSFTRRAFEEDRYFGRLALGGWQGHFFKHAQFPQRWSLASHMDITHKDWQAAFPSLLQQIESDQFEILKRTPSGDVLAGEIVLGGRPVPVVVKRPLRKHWYRYLNEILRGSRVRRAWKTAWNLVARSIPTAWPLLLMEKRRFGYVTGSLIVFERIPGQPLSSAFWSRMGPDAYHNLLHRVGRLLRKLESTRLFLYDAKAENWMIRDDPAVGPTPMLIDVDGIRRIKIAIGGFNRLLRSLRQNPAVPFTRDDALALAQGYCPFGSTAQLDKLCNLDPLT